MPQNKLKRDQYLNSNDSLLPGFPGYRTRQERSGLDPLDTNREAAFMEGTFYRNLFTLRLRTRNAFYLFLMFLFGVAVTFFMSFVLYALISTPIQIENSLKFYLGISAIYLICGFMFLTGFALLMNFLINIAVILGFGRNSAPKNKKIREKKLPRRRKDYR